MIAPQILEAAPEVPAPSLVLSVCGDSRAGVNASWRAAMIARDLRASLQRRNRAAHRNPGGGRGRVGQLAARRRVCIWRGGPLGTPQPSQQSDA
jgi:hypothetical protein